LVLDIETTDRHDVLANESGQRSSSILNGERGSVGLIG
jgi:hypothetical protein